jgi:hypothetical protein
MDLGDQTVSPAYGQLVVHVGPLSFTSPLGREGEFYFDSLRDGTFDAEVDSAVGTCRFQLVVPAKSPTAERPFIDVGRVKCAGTAPAVAPEVETPPGVVTPLPPAAAAPATPPAAEVAPVEKPAAKRGKRGGRR